MHPIAQTTKRSTYTLSRIQHIHIWYILTNICAVHTNKHIHYVLDSICVSASNEIHFVKSLSVLSILLTYSISAARRPPPTTPASNIASAIKLLATFVEINLIKALWHSGVAATLLCHATPAEYVHTCVYVCLFNKNAK